jgi:hypothetical protein
MSKKKKIIRPVGNRFTEEAGYLVASVILDAPDGLTTLTASSAVRTPEQSLKTGSTRLVVIKQGESLRYWTSKEGNCVDQKSFIRQLASYLSKKDGGKFEYTLSAAYTEANKNVVIDTDMLREHLTQPSTRMEGWIVNGGTVVADESRLDSWGPLTVEPGRDLYANLKKDLPEVEEAERVAASPGVMEQGVAFITGVVEGAGEGIHVITVAGAPNGVGRVFFTKDKDGLISISAEEDGEHVSAHTIIGLELSGMVEATLRSVKNNAGSAFGPVEEVRGWTVTVEAVTPLSADEVINKHSIDPDTGKLLNTDSRIGYRDAWEIAGGVAA